MEASYLILYPDSMVRTVWDFLGFLMILYQSIVIPFRICFESEPTGFLLAFETFIDVCFMLDIGTPPRSIA